jgi:hypothetical protein
MLRAFSALPRLLGLRVRPSTGILRCAQNDKQEQSQNDWNKQEQSQNDELEQAGVEPE